MESLLNILGKFLAPLMSWLLGRPRLRVWIQEDNPDVEVGGLRFEVENISDKATSLSPIVSASYLTIKRQLKSILFDVRELDRNLPPFTPIQFNASAREQQLGRGHGWFRCYIFTPSRGAACYV